MILKCELIVNSEMMNNYRYYQAYVKPDTLVLNSLAAVFRHADCL